MSRRTAALLILGAWFGALGWLAWRETSGEEESQIRLAAGRLAPGAAWYAVELGGIQIGTAGLTVDTTTTGFTLIEVVSLDWPPQDEVPGRLALRSDVTLSRPFRLLESRASYTEMGVPFFTELDAPSDTLVRLRLGRIGTEGPALGRRSAGSGLAGVEWSSVPAAFPFRLAAAGALARNEPFTTASVDPVTGRFASLTARPEAAPPFVVTDSAVLDTVSGRWRPVPTDTAETWWLAVDQGGIPVRLRVSAEGWVMEAVYPFGLSFRRDAFERVQTEYRRDRILGRLDGAPVAGSRPAGLRPGPGAASGGTVRAVLAGPNGPAPEAMTMFRGGRQRVVGDTIVIAGGVGEGSSDPIPAMRYRNTGGWSATDSTVLSRGLRLALEGHAAAGDTVAELVRWVAQDVRLDPAPDAPLAPAAVLEEGRAGPEGKARLLEALLRRAGYPARMVAGLLLSEPDLPGHTWVEVWRGRWEPVDPAWDQVPARTDLLRVMEGPARALTLMTVVGGLRPTVLDPQGAGRP